MVTHAPEKAALKFYRWNRIAVLQIRVDTARDLERLHNGTPLRATRCSVCKNPKCHECGFNKNTRYVRVESSPCYACRRPMRIAEAVCCGASFLPEQLTQEEEALARQHGCILKVCYSKTLDRSYLANVCEHCGRFVGNQHLMTSGAPRTQVWIGTSGYYCTRCGTW